VKGVSGALDDTLNGELSTKNANRKVWLVKVPSFLSETWSKLPKNAQVGAVKLKEESGKSTEMTISIKTDDPSIPKEYNLLYMAPPSSTYIFSENEDGQLSMDGNVEYKCDMKLVIGQEYRQLCRDRTVKSNQKNRSIQPMDDSLTLKSISSRDVNTKKRKLESEKRERMEKNDLIDIIFGIFEKSTYYDIKSLATATNQPTGFLKDVLNDLCILNKRGPHKGMYELKPQYKNRSGQKEEKE